MNTSGTEKFLVYLFVALVVFVAVLLFTVRQRPQRPLFRILMLALITVVGGMIFARITYRMHSPWWLFYGIPAFVTFALPPLVLRMSLRELLLYLPVALMMAPAIHIFFSFFFNWHDYMPLFYVPWWRELV